MAFCDFVVKFDPSKDTKQDITKRIIYSIIIKRLLSKKPCVLFVSGDSGEGKSYATLRFQEILMEIQGMKLEDYFHNINVMTPLEYGEKLDELLFNKDLKKVNIICMHEARNIVKAKHWHTFLSQCISDVNAMSRTIKRLCVMIVSQFIRDVTTDVRYTINYYIKISRPRGKKARMYLSVMWKDDRDLEKPKLKKRKLSGYLVYPNGKYKRFIPQYIELNKPSKEIIDLFEKADYESKALIIKNKLKKLIKEIKKDVGEDDKRLDLLVDHYAKNQDQISLIGKQRKGIWKIKPDMRDMLDLDAEDSKLFEIKLNDKLKELGDVDGNRV